MTNVPVKRAKPHVFRYESRWLMLTRTGSVFVLSEDLSGALFEDVPPSLLYDSIRAPVLSREKLL